jgi:hypothetical protein
MFFVCLQREEAATKISFPELESSLPREIRKTVDNDWRRYIREEGLEFHSAFQKAVRKHIPGIYYVVAAAEYVHKVPFHVALSYFLNRNNTDRFHHELGSDEVFELAQRLMDGARRITEKPLTRAPKWEQKPFSNSKQPVAPFATSLVKRRPYEIPKNYRRCGFCFKAFHLAEIGAHVDTHLNPIRLGSGPPIATKVIQKDPGFMLSSQETSSAKFKSGTCICCHHIPVPGDYYCYDCLPK